MARKKKRKDFEITFYENLLQERPDFIQALSCLGDAYTRKGFYKEGLDVDQRLASLRPDDPVAHYNLACSFSLVGEIKQAFSELKKAMLLGYEDISYILKDPDLENVRSHRNFKKFLAKIQKLDSAV